MKKVVIKLQAELEVPDTWNVEKDDNGEDILVVGDECCTFDIIPIWADGIESEAAEDKLDDAVYETVKDLSCEIK